MSAPNLSVGAATVGAINDKLNYIAGRIQKLFANGDGALDTTGNAATSDLADVATVSVTLQTPRAINGVPFDGSAPITVPAAAGTLTGGTLAAGVTRSSLTHIGSLNVYANNAAAVLGGLSPGDLYITGIDPEFVAVVR